VIRRIADFLGLALLGGGLVWAITAQFPRDRSLAIGIYVLVVGALALLTLTQATLAAHPAAVSPFERALERRPPRDERLPELERLEREVLLGMSTAFDFHYHLRPLLQDVARRKLSVAQGIDLDAEPDHARAVLGERTWELVRPDRESPRDRLGPGVDAADLAAAVETLANM